MELATLQGCAVLVCCRWRMPVELALDLASLALYDVILFGEPACT
jgi:hypothetical protein